MFILVQLLHFTNYASNEEDNYNRFPGLQNNDVIYLKGINGLSQLNDRRFIVTENVSLS